MINKKAEIQYLAGVINENQYHEIFGFGKSATTKKHVIDFGPCNLDIVNNDLHIKSDHDDLMGVIYYSTIDKTIQLSDEQLDSLIHQFKDDIALKELEDHKNLGRTFHQKYIQVYLKVEDGELKFDDKFSTCFNYKCKIKLEPNQLDQLKR